MASAAGAANSARVEVVRTDLGERLTTDIDSAEASRGQAELDWPIEVVVVPTVRDADGLALSSRNRFLSPPERQQALVLSRMLRTVESAWLAGVRGGAALLEVGREVLARVLAVRIDYAVIVDPARLDALDAVVPGAIAAVAARVGTTRLIDNVILAERGS